LLSRDGDRQFEARSHPVQSRAFEAGDRPWSIRALLGRRILPRGHFTWSWCAPQRNRRSGTFERIGSAFGGMTPVISRASRPAKTLRQACPASAMTVPIGVPVGAAVASRRPRIARPSLSAPFVTATSRMTPLRSSTIPVLPAARLEAPLPGGRRHGRIGIGEADLLEPAGRPGPLQALPSIGRHVRVRLGNGIDMAPRQALPGDVGADQRGIWTISPCAMPAEMHAFTVRSKMRRKRPAPQRCRIRVSEK
jgi:hypothetical protein